MFYIILGIVLVVTISAAFIKKKSTVESPLEETEELPLSPVIVPAQISAQEEQDKPEAITKIEKITYDVSEKPETLKVETLVAPPLTSPGVSGSTVYSSAGEVIRAPDSVKRDAYGLRWSSRSSELNVNGVILRGAMIYWADGKPGIEEPSCIDITLPFEVTHSERIKDSAENYAMMTPSQRGGYLTWLSGGRNLMPSDLSWVSLWFMGIERRALLDKQDIAQCMVESLRMLPFVRNEKLYSNMKNLSVWLTVKFMLPEDQLLKLIQNMKDAPVEFFNVILTTYSNAKLPLPSYLAYIIMCYSPIAGKSAPYMEDLINAFAGIYKDQTGGGLILMTPGAKIPLTYVSTNPSIPENKRKQDIIDLPDFFKDIMQFKPLINSWNEFIKKYEENYFEEETDEIKHTDWEPFIQENLNGGELPLIIKLGAIASFLEIEQTEKPSSTERKEISEIARVEGYLIIPELCISGKEYKWEDNVALTSIAMGEKISDDYNSAALMLEFITALAGENAEKYGGVQEILNTTINYFSLVNEELTRLNILPDTFDEEMQSPDNLGECLQAWIKTEDREYIRNVVYDMLKLSKEPDDSDGSKDNEKSSDSENNGDSDHVKLISEKLHQVLDIKTETYEKITTIPPMTGEKLVEILSSLFKK